MKTDKFSSTALVVALGHLYSARHPVTRGLTDPHTADLLERMLPRIKPGLGRVMHWMDKGIFRAGADLLSRATIPNICAHYALRKRRLEAVARRTLEQGVGRVVVLGAGFDTLAYRLSFLYPRVSFIEADHPATQGAKLAALESLDAPGDNLSFLHLDLEKDTPRFADDVPTLLIAEGLLMYLRPRRVRRIFRDLRRSGAGSRMVFTFMANVENGRICFRGQSRLIDLWLKLKSEPFTWGAGESRARDMLAQLGFAEPVFSHARDLKAEYLPDCPPDFHPASGESVCLVDMPRSVSCSRIRRNTKISV